MGGDFLRTTLQDDTSNAISEANPLQVSSVQTVRDSLVNSSTTNLTAGDTFTGVAASTLGVNAIQVSLKTTQNCTVYIDQSPDGNNWDITDTYNYYYSIGNFGVTVQAINSYFRIRVTNNGTLTTTSFRLQSVLCPIVEALPRSLDENGNLKVSIESTKDEYGFGVENTPMGELRTVIPTRLVGANFEGGTLDTNYWTSALVNSATATQANCEVVLDTKTTATNGTARLYSFRRGRYVSGSSMCYRSVIVLSEGATNNKRRFGIAYSATMPTTTDTITDGAWFQLNGTTFSIVTKRANAADVVVSSGDFNGTLGSIYSPGTTVKTYEIYWTNSKVMFVVGDKILHTVTASTSTWAGTMNFYIYMDNTNSSNLQTSNTLSCRVASIRRLGQLFTQPTSYYFAIGTTAGVNLKLSAGNLHGIVISGAVNNTTITLSDSTSGATPPIFVWTAGSSSTQPYSIDFKGIPFFTGLRLTVAAQNASVTVIYE
jgi:hypothetical protein